jgi:iron complex transport system ATP-binding protein
MSVTLTSVSVHRARLAVLQDVTATLPSRRLTALVGPNGAGKSTLLRAVAGLVPARGRIQVGDAELARLSLTDRARRMAWVPDQTAVPFSFGALETVVMGRFAWHRGVPGADDRQRALDAMAELGIDALRDRPLDALSSGERQKVLIARALAGDTEVLLLDEPCANLDVAATLKLLSLLRDLAARGRTVCLTLHDLPLAARFADACVCLADGRVAGHGEASEVLTPALLRSVFGVAARPAVTAAHDTTLFLDLP